MNTSQPAQYTAPSAAASPAADPPPPPLLASPAAGQAKRMASGSIARRHPAQLTRPEAAAAPAAAPAEFPAPLWWLPGAFTCPCELCHEPYPALLLRLTIPRNGLIVPRPPAHTLPTSHNIKGGGRDLLL